MAKYYTFTEKNDIIVRLRNGDNFEHDIQLFRKTFPAHPLNRDLQMVNQFNRAELDGRMLFELLGKVSEFDITLNRKLYEEGTGSGEDPEATQEEKIEILIGKYGENYAVKSTDELISFATYLGIDIPENISDWGPFVGKPLSRILEALIDPDPDKDNEDEDNEENLPELPEAPEDATREEKVQIIIDTYGEEYEAKDIEELIKFANYAGFPLPDNIDDLQQFVGWSLAQLKTIADTVPQTQSATIPTSGIIGQIIQNSDSSLTIAEAQILEASSDLQSQLATEEEKNEAGEDTESDKTKTPAADADIPSAPEPEHVEEQKAGETTEAGKKKVKGGKKMNSPE